MPKFTARAHLHRLLTSCAHVPARAWVAGFSALRRALYQVSYQHTCRALRRRMAFTPSSSKTSLRVSAGGRRPRRTGEQLAAEASTICSTRGGTRTRNLLLRREAPYPLGHTSRRILLPLKRIVLKICVASVARAMCQTPTPKWHGSRSSVQGTRLDSAESASAKQGLWDCVLTARYISFGFVRLHAFRAQIGWLVRRRSYVHSSTVTHAQHFLE